MASLMNTHSLRPASFYLFSNYRFYRTAKSLGQTFNSTIGCLSYIFIAQFIGANGLPRNICKFCQFFPGKPCFFANSLKPCPFIYIQPGSYLSCKRHDASTEQNLKKSNSILRFPIDFLKIAQKPFTHNPVHDKVSFGKHLIVPLGTTAAGHTLH